MKKISIFFVFLCLGCTHTYQSISQKQAQNLIENGAVVLDVRSEIEYNQGHIKGAVQVPYYEMDTLNYDKNTKIIVYCKTGSRSHKAADLLIELGYKNVYDLGGKENYQELLEK